MELDFWNMNFISELKSVMESRQADSRFSKKKQEYRELRNKVEAVGGRLSDFNKEQPAAVSAVKPGDRNKGKEVLKEMARR